MASDGKPRSWGRFERPDPCWLVAVAGGRSVVGLQSNQFPR